MSVPARKYTDLPRLFESGELGSLNDWQLLERFITHRDELAFELLVQRHGPMVLGVCRRRLSNHCDVEDAFQATFLVLLRRAGSICPMDSLGPWLHGVALKVSQQARGAAARRSSKEQPGLFVDGTAPEPCPEDFERRQILDEEIDRLPARYRLPVVLCYLEGQTHEQAAKALQWPLGTVKGRLARARSLLESRLARRGIAGSATVAAVLLGSNARAAVSPSLVLSTCRMAGRLDTATLMTSIVSSSITRLVQGVLSTMYIQKLKMLVTVFGMTGIVLTGAGVLARQQAKPGDQSSATPAEVAGKDLKAAPDSPASRGSAGSNADAQESKSPSDYLSQLHRRALYDAERAYQYTLEEFRVGKSSLERLYLAARLFTDSEAIAAQNEAERLKVAEHHLDRMRMLARINKELGHGDSSESDAARSSAYVAEAEVLLERAKTVRTEPEASDQPSDTPGPDAKSRTILARLEQPIAMSFPNETPLEDVLKYVKSALSGPNDSGITMYVDPLGLQAADKTLTSPISIDLEGVPLKITLRLLLKQLGLRYFVDDGILFITDESNTQTRLPRTDPSPFIEKEEKAMRGELPLEAMKQFVEELKVRKELIGLLKELQSDDVAKRGKQ